MKKLYMFVLIAGLMLSCSGELEDMNVNVKNPSSVSGESLFTAAQKNLIDQMSETNVNRNIFRLFAQQWAQTTYTDESNYDVINRNIPEQHWSELYRFTLKNLEQSTIAITESNDIESVKNNKLQMIEILNVYTYSILVETFGNIPYSEALKIDILAPKYDDEETVYMDLLNRLDAAVSKLDEGASSFGHTDILYHGDVMAWKKFAHSLKLRMGMLLADVNSAKAKSVVESAVSAGVFTGNADNAALAYDRAAPNTNPVYVALVTSGRSDYIPASTIIDIMQPRTYDAEGKVVAGSVKYTDPRAKAYFASNIDADASVPETVYFGGIYGANNTFANYTHIGARMHEPTNPGVILDYAEVEFLLAEAVERGYSVGGSAESHYNKAVTASVEFWGGTADEAEAYLAIPEIAYSTAEGGYKQKIGVQKWIALYNRGYTAWREWRRLDFPKLEAPEGAMVNSVPVRYTYPIAEQTLNPAGWGAVKDNYGGDVLTAKLFWDVN